MASHHALENVVRSAVASAGKDGVATLGNGVACLLGRVCLSPRGLGNRLDSSLVQHGRGRSNIRQSPLTATARERVVEERGFVHGGQWDCTENEFPSGASQVATLVSFY
jgi:hypothetical protein